MGRFDSDVCGRTVLLGRHNNYRNIGGASHATGPGYLVREEHITPVENPDARRNSV